MTDTAAVLQATYSDFRLIKTRKVISLSFEVPIEQASQVYAVLGMPDPSKERWVAIAPLVPDAAATHMAKYEFIDPLKAMLPAVFADKPDYGDSIASERLSKASQKKTAADKNMVDNAYGQYAKALKLQGFFRFKEVQAAIGTDAEFREWVRRQPSCISGEFDQPSPEGECTRNIAAHVRRAKNAGQAYKPEYCCVPMTHTEHQLQHQQGEAYVYAMMLYKTSIPDGNGRILPKAEIAKEWFDKQAVKYAEEWAWETFKAQMGVSSMTEVHPTSMLAWATDKGVAHLLPKEFKQ